ncbi:MAG: hypothetical protein SFZ24_03490 [Planctomycetota bacterium]|nr:hypothetical protein [Planctomycetota bacterium]
MRVLLLADRSLASREHAMLRRLEIGLVDEGLRVIRCVPERSMPEESTGLEACVEYTDSRWRLDAWRPEKPILRRLAAVDSIAASDNEPDIGVIHAWGEACWPLALSLALELGADLALEVWSRQSLARVAWAESHAGRLAALGASGLWLAPDDAMRTALARSTRRWPVRTSDWGVHMPADPVVRAADAPIETVCILASGRDPLATINMLSGLARACAGRQPPMIFLDDAAPAAAPAIYRHADALGLLPRLTLTAALESRRQLVLQADAFVYPDCFGEHHSLVLEFMAAGLVPILRADRLVSVASDADIAALVQEPSELGWESAFRSVFEDPARARRLAAAAQAHIRTSRLAHRQIASTVAAYNAAVAGRPMPLAAARR